MNNLIRAFIALKIDPEPAMLKMIGDIKKCLSRERIKWVDESSLHLTLKFLGDIPAGQVSGIRSVLTDICQRTEKLKFSLKGIGYFKIKGNPSVLYVNIKCDEQLKRLAEEIDIRLEEIDITREVRHFRPHLTIARIKDISDKEVFYALCDRYRSTHLQSMSISNIILYQSILKYDGPLYKNLAVIRLK